MVVAIAPSFLDPQEYVRARMEFLPKMAAPWGGSLWRSGRSILRNVVPRDPSEPSAILLTLGPDIWRHYRGSSRSDTLFSLSPSLEDASCLNGLRSELRHNGQQPSSVFLEEGVVGF
jgi:hypothetical protein